MATSTATDDSQPVYYTSDIKRDYRVGDRCVRKWIAKEKLPLPDGNLNGRNFWLASTYEQWKRDVLAGKYRRERRPPGAHNAGSTEPRAFGRDAGSDVHTSVTEEVSQPRRSRSRRSVMRADNAAPVSQTGRGRGHRRGATIMPYRPRRMRSCIGCGLRLAPDSPAHHTLCRLCYRGAGLYRAVLQYLQVSR